MTLVSAGVLIADAIAAGRAVVAFNAITLEHAEAIVTGATRANRGVILQVSENAVRFHGGFRPLLLACRALAEEAPVAIALHLDHVESEALVVEATSAAHELGLGSIMIDASKLPWDENVHTTALLASQAHAAGLWVEAELGAIGGKDGAHAPGVRTDPKEAEMFVAATGVDALAVAVGSSHAMQARDAKLDVELIVRLDATVPVPLVLHGSSGVSDATLVAAVRAGIRKVNVGTALNVAGTSALRDSLASSPDSVDPRPFTTASRDAMTVVVTEFVSLVG